LPRPDLPELPGLLGAGMILETARAIASAQEWSGAIPWYPGGHTDPWNHVECAMALSAAGFLDEAVRAYAWLRNVQRADGSWPSRVRAGVVEDACAETNQCAYVAVGVWHHLLVTGDERFALRMWPVVRAALDFVVGHQTDRGELRWAQGTGGSPPDEALLAGSASSCQSLRCGLALADRLGEPQVEWELAAGRLVHVVAEHPEAFLDKDRFSMDWYYPVLGGALRGAGARQRISERWDTFVVNGYGARCVSDQAWVTGAETCELVLTLETLGERDRALALVGDVQHLREADGSYWTGYQLEERIRWPDERSTWTAAAVVLAVDALSNATPGSGIFRAEALPEGIDLEEPVCGCAPEWLSPVTER
jgi:hypothetical protein